MELAQLEYSLPRLKQMWSHLSRQKGGGIGLRGPGETQLESDRRMVGSRIRDLKQKLNEVTARKEREVKSRSEEHTISLVGYTNAGKSQLMNTLTKAGVFVKNQLFSTLDTRTRQWRIRDWGRVLLSDTVGFIRDLPHHLVASFKATLSEARHAKLLLHVVDASSPQAEDHIRAVTSVLGELECDQKPALLVLNKIDKLADRSLLTLLEAHHPRAVAVSGLTGEGIDRLEDAVMEAAGGGFRGGRSGHRRGQWQGAGVPERSRRGISSGVPRRLERGGDPLPPAEAPAPPHRRTNGEGAVRGTGAEARTGTAGARKRVKRVGISTGTAPASMRPEPRALRSRS